VSFVARKQFSTNAEHTAANGKTKHAVRNEFSDRWLSICWRENEGAIIYGPNYLRAFAERLIAEHLQQTSQRIGNIALFIYHQNALFHGSLLSTPALVPPFSDEALPACLRSFYNRASNGQVL
jgi:hypothetical protein